MGKLLMIHSHTLRFMKRNQSSNKKKLMFLLQRQRKPIDDTTQNLQQLCYSIVLFSLEYKTIKNVIDCFSNEWPVHHEFPINAMQYCFQIFPLSWIFGVKEI
eukprot:Gb_29611 [translate_table: standard]